MTHLALLTSLCQKKSTNIPKDEKFKKTYKLLTSQFYKVDFAYGELEAIEEISKNYTLTQVYGAMSQSNVKNAWYLNKILINTLQNSDYKLVDELEIDDSEKGLKNNLDFINGYV